MSMIFVQFIKFHESSMIFQGTLSFAGFPENCGHCPVKSFVYVQYIFQAPACL